MLKTLWIVLAVALLSGCPRPPGPACYTINGIPSTGCPDPRARATPNGWAAAAAPPSMGLRASPWDDAPW